MLIDGRPYPRHLIISDEWNIHAASRERLMGQPRYAEEEQEFLRTFETRLGATGLQRLTEMATELGLEYFGLDFSPRPDGSLLLFEVNPCMRVLSDRPKPESDGYRRPYVEAIRSALRDLILRMSEAAGSGVSR
jgi:hypothetical protein